MVILRMCLVGCSNTLETIARNKSPLISLAEADVYSWFYVLMTLCFNLGFQPVGQPFPLIDEERGL